MRSQLRRSLAALTSAALLAFASCSSARYTPGSIVVLIESSPTSLDPRIGLDAQSEHIDQLLFDSLLHKRPDFTLAPWLATSWETPDPLTYIFHLHTGVRFHNGANLTSRDVKWTLDSLLNGTVLSAKSGTFRSIDRIDAPDPATLIIHLKNPDNALLWNLSEGAIGIVPYGSGRDFQQHPIGSGPFRFVSQQTDKEVVIERNPDGWQPPPTLSRVRFSVVPDAITRALELRKGSAEVAINALTADMVYALRNDRNVQVQDVPGTIVQYVTFNVTQPPLNDPRVRRAIALSIDRQAIVHALWRDHARLADSLLPPGHWARPDNLPQLNYDPATARAMLDQAGYPEGRHHIRFHVELKTSTDESSRLLAAILQQQLQQVGIALDIRSFEFATFYADITRGAFQMYSLRFIGGNEDPDILRYAFATSSFPPKGANRQHYSNPDFDRLVADAAVSPSLDTRRTDYFAAQEILARDLPSMNLWYLDTVLVHTLRLRNVVPARSADYDFLRSASTAD